MSDIEPSFQLKLSGQLNVYTEVWLHTRTCCKNKFQTELTHL